MPASSALQSKGMFLTACIFIVCAIIVIFVIRQVMVGRAGDPNTNDDLFDMNELRTAASSIVWTFSTDGTQAPASLVTSKLELVVATGNVPVLELSWCANAGAAQSNPAAAPWTLLWSSAEGMSTDDSAYTAASTEIAELAKQGYASPFVLYRDLDEEGVCGHALFVRGRWIFVGASPNVNLAWSPLCGSEPLASSTSADPDLPSWFPRGFAQAPGSTAPVRVLTTGNFGLVLEPHGDLQILRISDSSVLWSARISSATADPVERLPVAAGCRL